MPGFSTAAQPTVRLVVHVTTLLVGGAGLGWDVLPEGNPVGDEYVYSRAELEAAFMVWGQMVALTLIRATADQFALAAHDLYTGSLLGRHSWVRSAETHKLRPHGEPWIVWDEVPHPVTVPKPTLILMQPMPVLHRLCA